MSTTTRKSVLGIAAAAAVSAGLFASPAQAVVSYQANVDVYDAVDNDFVAGNGVPINNFVQDSATPLDANGQSVSVAVKPRNRDTGQANAIVNNNYYHVTPGQSAINPARPQLAIDFQFDPGSVPSATSDYRIQIDIDYDPAPGSATFFTLNQPYTWWAANTDGEFNAGSTNQSATPTLHAWNDANVPYVISNTTNLSFAPQSTSPAAVLFPYNSSATGEYEVRLTAFSPDGSTQLAQATAFAVVPEPAGLGLLALGGVMLLGHRGRRSTAKA
jgi:hypothetical protein